MLNSWHRYQAGHPQGFGLASLVDIARLFKRSLAEVFLHNGLNYGEELTSDKIWASKCFLPSWSN